ncbi:MAG: hypothetical protein QM767_26910 [Anaeromyxobacter sp.]
MGVPLVTHPGVAMVSLTGSIPTGQRSSSRRPGT